MGRGSRNNVLAGLLVIGAIGASVGVLSLLGGLYERIGKVTRTVQFDVAEGVTGLKPGSEVRLGGLKVGQVSAVAPMIADGRVTGMTVKISIDPKIAPLREGAVAFLEVALLGSVSNINFSNVGSGEMLSESSVIPGQVAAPGFLAGAGFGDEQKTQLQSILANADAGVLTFKNTLADFEGRKGKWFDDFDSMTTNGRSLMQQANDATPEIIQKVKDAADETKALMADGRKIISENKPDFDTTIDNALAFTEQLKRMGADGEAIAERLKNTTVKMAEDLLGDARSRVNEAGGTLNSMLAKGDAFASEQIPVVRAALAKLRLSGDQLAATLGEVRRSPWRLIYRPDTRDLEFELLYDSARAYAQAVTDLTSATDALKGLSDAGQLKAGERSVQELLSNLDAAAAKYEATQDEFFRQFKAKGK